MLIAEREKIPIYEIQRLENASYRHRILSKLLNNLLPPIAPIKPLLQQNSLNPKPGDKWRVGHRRKKLNSKI
jgi:hypothetical protein